MALGRAPSCGRPERLRCRAWRPANRSGHSCLLDLLISRGGDWTAYGFTDTSCLVQRCVCASLPQTGQ